MDCTILAALLVIADFLTYFHVTFLGITDILWVVLVLPILGSLIMSQVLHTKNFSFQEWLIYCVGTGIASLMLLGLVINTIGLQLNYPVLTRSVMMPVINIVFVTLLLLRAKLVLLSPTHKRLFPKFLSKTSPVHITRVTLPLLLPIMAVIGATRLNNGGGNSVALITLILVFAYVLTLMLFVRKLEYQDITVGLFVIALSLALSVSMRSNYLIGFDIHQEFQVFSATANSGLWHPHIFANSAYNACLSITILPAMLKALMPISSEYLFKFIMPLVFGIMPIIIFVIANHRLKHKRHAFIASLFFIVQGPFIFEFPGLIRQQIGLIFFGLIFASAMSLKLSRKAKGILLTLFGMAMVTSHYSTTYVTAILLILLVTFRPLFLWMRDGLFKNVSYRTNGVQEASWYISPLLVLVIIFSAFLWYGETLQATGGVIKKVTTSITSYTSIFNSDSHSDFVTGVFGLGGYTYNSQTLQKIALSSAVKGGYRPSTDQYEPVPASPQGPLITNTAKHTAFNFEHKIIPLFSGAMVAVGLLSMLIAALLNRGSLDDGLLATASGCLFLMLALLPNISQDYNLDRLYQQLIVVISPAYIYGFLVLFKQWIKPMTLTLVMSLVTLGYLLGTSGLADQFIFGISNINLINDGTNYDHYYTKAGEVESLRWLNNLPSLTKLNLDRYSVLDAQAYTNIETSKLSPEVLPSAIRSTNFVYASAANKNKGLSFSLYHNHIITFNFPQQYLQSNKNTIYSNKDSVIYR